MEKRPLERDRECHEERQVRIEECAAPIRRAIPPEKERDEGEPGEIREGKRRKTEPEQDTGNRRRCNAAS